jgi:predicted ester cyclase
MTRQQIEELFARRERAQLRHDVDAFSALFAADAVVESPTAGGTVQGRSAIAEITRAWYVGFPDVVFATDLLVIDGEHAVWVGESRGTDTGGFLGLPPTGKPFSLPMMSLCTLKDGLVVHERRIYDFTGLLMQIGVLKAKPA